MAAGTEADVVGLIADQQTRMRRGMRLVARSAVNRHADFGVVGRVHLIDHRMFIHWVAKSVLDGQPRYFSKVVLRQPYFAIENRDYMSLLDLHRLCVRAMTFQAKLVRRARAQQVRILATVGSVAGRAALLERGLVQVLPLMLFSLVGVARRASADRIRLDETRSPARVGVVTGDAIALCARVLHLRRFDRLCLLVVTHDAQRLRVGLGQNHFPVLRSRMTCVAGFIRERLVSKLLDQLGTVGLVWVVAGQAIGFRYRLVLVSLDDVGVSRIMTVDTKLRRSLIEVEGKLADRLVACFVSRVTGFASHVQGCVTASTCRNTLPGLVTAETEIRLFRTAGRL